MARIPNKRYSGEFKEAVVKEMQEKKLSHREAAEKHGILSPATVGKWAKLYAQGGLSRLNTDGRIIRWKKASEDSEDDLATENKRLRAEIDYLKKLNALVLERPQPKKNPKR